MREFLVEYAAGTLPVELRDEVTAHVAGCAACRTEVAGWRALVVCPQPPPGPQIVRQVMLRGALAPPRRLVAMGRRWRLPLLLLGAQARLVPAVVWAASAVVIAAATLLAWRSAPGSAGTVFGVVAPIVAALSVVSTCDRGRDAAAEVCAATQTSPRLVLLARVTLVLAGDLALALAASTGLWLLQVPDGDLTMLVEAWLGPTALLSGLALLAAVMLGAELAAGAATAVWLLRLAAGGWLGFPAAWLSAVRAVWSTNLGTVAAAVLLFAVAGVLAGRGEPAGRYNATSLI